MAGLWSARRGGDAAIRVGIRMRLSVLGVRADCRRKSGMYLRTIDQRNKDGSVVRYMQPAHNERHPVSGNAVARMVHSFGRRISWTGRRRRGWSWP